MPNAPKLDDRSAELLLDDIVNAAGPNDEHAGWFVETNYGIIFFPDAPVGYPAIAVAEMRHEWNYAWVLLEDYEEVDGVRYAELMLAAATSTRRARVEPVVEVDHQIRFA